MGSLQKIISGGQTGVDRAALDYAISVSMPHGGKVPQGFWAEDGTIDRNKYSGLVETQVADPDFRTEQNVRESDGTLIITKGPPDRGTKETLRFIEELHKPSLLIDLAQSSLPNAILSVRSFLQKHEIKVLNIAGPRESQVLGGIYHQAFSFLAAALAPEATTHSTADSIQTACHLHAQALANFRHWDAIRWNSVAWLVSLIAVVATIFAQEHAPRPAIIGSVFAICALLGLIDLLLLWNLKSYHTSCMAELSGHIQRLVGNGPIADALQKALPFSFEGGFWKTATVWLLLLVGLLTLACTSAAVWFLGAPG